MSQSFSVAGAHDVKARVGVTLLAILPVFAAVVDSFVSLGHFRAGKWPRHEMFHLLMGLAGLIGAYGLIFVLVLIPLRRGERWAWFAVAGAALTVHGGQLLSDLATGGGLRNQAPFLGNGSVVFAGIVVILVIYIVGLALTWPATRERRG